MLLTRKEFKNKLKWCQMNEDQIKMDIIATHRHNKDFAKFWNKTNKLKLKPSIPVSVEGSQDHNEIADLFMNKFNPPTTCNGPGGARGGSSCGSRSNCQPRDTSRLHVSADDVYSCVKGMKRGKSPGHDGLSVEHILFAGPLLFDKVATFFNACIDHNYLPHNFMKTTVIPIIKNRTGDSSSLSNYRPISLATVLSKIFERLIAQHLNENNIPLSDAQFGFRQRMSTDLAIFALKNTVHKYLSRKTSVFACFLDLSRAFDSINYKKLWDKMRDTKVPPDIVNVLEYWYGNQVNQVRWGSAYSRPYRLTCGVRQGGVTSTILFNLYVNELIEELSRSRVGCNVGGISVNNLSYADDMVLLSPSANGLRLLVGICERYAATHQLMYNVQKTEVMIFKYGKGPETVLPITLNNFTLKIVSTFKYLGHVLNEKLTDDNDLERQRRSIACRSNMLARRFARCSKQVKTTLFEAYCQAFYTSQLWYQYTKRAYNSLRVQYNNAFRAMFNLRWRCSASGMFFESRVGDFFSVLRKMRASFRTRLLTCKNKIVNTVFRTIFVTRIKLFNLSIDYDVTVTR